MVEHFRLLRRQLSYLGSNIKRCLFMSGFIECIGSLMRHRNYEMFLKWILLGFSLF